MTVLFSEPLSNALAATVLIYGRTSLVTEGEDLLMKHLEGVTLEM